MIIDLLSIGGQDKGSPEEAEGLKTEMGRRNQEGRFLDTLFIPLPLDLDFSLCPDGGNRFLTLKKGSGERFDGDGFLLDKAWRGSAADKEGKGEKCKPHEGW